MHRALIVSVLLGLAAATASAQDPVKVAPNQCSVAFENEYVRVLHWTEAPGDKTPMHEHPALVSISVTPTKTRMTTADGKVRETESQAGQATFSEPEKHSSELLGTTAGEIVQVELKKKPGAALTAIPAGEDSVAVDPKHYSVVLQNDRVRVLRLHYAPGEKSVMHSHPANVAVFITGGQATFGLPDGTSSRSDTKAGQVIWSDTQRHLPSNTGSKPFDVVLVELR
jgi:quercetin dioxygenase-like cupin family protein